MNIIFKKIILLKWLLLPVILCVKLIVVQIDGFILSSLLYQTFHIYEDTIEFHCKRNTTIDDKVRMNN